jgi:phosphoglycolate phosphatase-like HAD superfamily hydrolase
MATHISLQAEPLQGILWDVDGTLSDSFMLGFSSTQTVLENNGKERITEEEYHQGTRLTTPRRLAWHVTGDPDNPIGLSLGQQFDSLYVDLVSPTTAPLYAGMPELLHELSSSKKVVLGALSNACGAYVSAVLRENKLKEIFCLGLGADEVPRAKPYPDGLLHCCNVLKLSPSR